MTTPEAKSVAAVKQDVSLFAPQVDLQQMKQYRSQLELTRLTRNTGSEDVVIGLNAGVTAQIDLPSSAYNLKRSVLAWTETYPLVANRVINVPADTVATVDSAQLRSSKGPTLMDMQYVPQYLKAVGKLETTFEKLQTNKKESVLWKCSARPDFTVTATDAKGSIYRIAAPSEAAYVASGAVPSAIGDVKYAVDGKVMAVSVSAVQTVTDPKAYRYDGTQVDNPYTENLYVYQSALGQQLVIYRRLELGDLFPDTICSKDQTLYFGDTMQFILNFGQGINYGWLSTSTNPSATPTALSTVPLITNFRLYLAQERNENVIATLQSKFMSGTLEYLTAFPQMYKNPFTGTPTSQNVTIRVNSAQGPRLKRIIHTMFDGAEATNTRYEISRTSAATPSVSTAGSYYTMVDNRRRQQFNVDMTAGVDEDYMLMYPHLKGTAIQSLNHFKYNWCHLEAFDEVGSVAERSESDQQIHKGLDLTNGREVKWDFALTLAAGYNLNHFTFCVFERNIRVSARGIDVNGMLG